MVIPRLSPPLFLLPPLLSVMHFLWKGFQTARIRAEHNAVPAHEHKHANGRGHSQSQNQEFPQIHSGIPHSGRFGSGSRSGFMKIPSTMPKSRPKVERARRAKQLTARIIGNILHIIRILQALYFELFMRPNLYVSRALRKLGSDIRSARLRRRLPMALVAERAGISTRTLGSIEKGESGVSLGNVAAVLYALGMGTPFADLLDQKNDHFGLMLDEERLPKRARLPKRNE